MTVGATTVPAVVTRLLEIAAQSYPAVQLGAPTTNAERDGLYLLTSSDGPASINADTVWNQIGALGQDETYTIPCLAYARSGDDDPATRLQLLTDASGILQGFAEALVADVSLNLPMVRNVHVTNAVTDLLLDSGTNGCVVRVAFTVQATARI